MDFTEYEIELLDGLIEVYTDKAKRWAEVENGNGLGIKQSLKCTNIVTLLCKIQRGG